MNLPNRLTLFRLILTLLLVIALTTSMLHGNTIALFLFLIAVITDYLDGYIARKYALITYFGQLMDPLVDKILMASTFICLIPTIPAWAVIIIISREFLITGLRLLASTQNRILPAERIGKHKTAWQMVTAIVLLLVRAINDWTSLQIPYVDSLLMPLLIYVTVFLTLYSGLSYLWKNRDLLVG